MLYVLCCKQEGLVKALGSRFDYQPIGTVIRPTLQTKKFARLQVSLLITEHVPGSEHGCFDGDEIMLMMVEALSGSEDTFRLMVEGWPSVEVLSLDMLGHSLV